MAGSIPTTIGIIIDGNRRWARERGLPTLVGHQAGYEKVKELAFWALDSGIKNVIVYAFSTENWNRSSEEVGYLMNLLKRLVGEGAAHFKKENIKITVIGQRGRLAPDVRETVVKAERETAGCDALNLVIALSYGGRAEIVAAVNELLVDDARRSEITESEFAHYLWTRDIPDPDLIIRSGGEQRLSNFLPWQSTYSELFFVPEYWPAFEKKHFEKILAEYAERQRRHGK